MERKQLLYGLLFALGLFFTASYSIDNRGFHSGIYGIIGCLLMVAAYCGFNWDKLKAHDHHARVILDWLVGITTFIIILDIAEAILA